VVEKDDEGILHFETSTPAGYKDDPLYMGSGPALDYFIKTHPSATTPSGSYGYVTPDAEYAVLVDTGTVPTIVPLTGVSFGDFYAESGSTIFQVTTSAATDAAIAALPAGAKGFQVIYSLYDWEMDQAIESEVGSIAWRGGKSGGPNGNVIFTAPDTDAIMIATGGTGSVISENMTKTFNGVTMTWVKTTRTLTFSRRVRSLPHSASEANYNVAKPILDTILATTQQGSSNKAWQMTAETRPSGIYPERVPDPNSPATTGILKGTDRDVYDHTRHYALDPAITDLNTLWQFYQMPQCGTLRISYDDLRNWVGSMANAPFTPWQSQRWGYIEEVRSNSTNYGHVQRFYDNFGKISWIRYMNGAWDAWQQL
jgi:hypothetical protein